MGLIHSLTHSLTHSLIQVAAESRLAQRVHKTEQVMADMQRQQSEAFKRKYEQIRKWVSQSKCVLIYHWICY